MASEILPTNLLYEIFSRLPIKSLFRFRCVSSVCRSIIDDPYLAYMHQTRCAEEPNVLVFHHPYYITDVMFRREGEFSKDIMLSVSELETLKKYDLECSCYGLSCFTRPWDKISHVVLFNPLRQQVVSLRPTPVAFLQQGDTLYGLGFDCSKNTYKIVRVFINRRDFTTFYAEVFTLGTSSWRVVPKVPSCHLSKGPVHACGNIYWLASCEVDDPHLGGCFGYNKVVSFDISKEEFGFIYLPNIFKWCQLLELNGNLAVVDLSMSKTSIKIWVLIKEYERKEHWVKEYEIDLKPPKRDQFFIDRSDIDQVVGLVGSGQELIVRCYGRLYSCDPKNGTLRHVYDPKFYCCNNNVICHTGSLLSISKFHAN